MKFRAAKKGLGRGAVNVYAALDTLKKTVCERSAARLPLILINEKF